MNLPEFLAELQKTSGWGIHNESIRSRVDCPITAVATLITDETFSAADYMLAAHKIGLPLDLTEQISAASDIDQKSQIYYEETEDYPDKKLIAEYQELQGLREMILKACGLSGEITK